MIKKEKEQGLCDEKKKNASWLEREVWFGLFGFMAYQPL